VPQVSAPLPFDHRDSASLPYCRTHMHRYVTHFFAGSRCLTEIVCVFLGTFAGVLAKSVSHKDAVTIRSGSADPSLAGSFGNFKATGLFDSLRPRTSDTAPKFHQRPNFTSKSRDISGGVEVGGAGRGTVGWGEGGGHTLGVVVGKRESEENGRAVARDAGPVVKDARPQTADLFLMRPSTKGGR
jgi:hypothetical protein